MLLAVYLVQGFRAKVGRSTIAKAAAIVAVCLAVAVTNPAGLQRMAIWRYMSTTEVERTPKDVVAARTINDRVFIWKAALTMFAEHPVLGHGLGSFPVELERIWKFDRSFYSEPEGFHAHNSALHLAAEYGMVGLVLFVVLVVALTVLLVRAAFRETPGSFQYALSLGALAMLFSQAVGSLADHNICSPAIMLPLTTFIGMSLGSSAGDSGGGTWLSSSPTASTSSRPSR